jgi:hypothetical protein
VRVFVVEKSVFSGDDPRQPHRRLDVVMKVDRGETDMRTATPGGQTTTEKKRQNADDASHPTLYTSQLP